MPYLLDTNHCIYLMNGWNTEEEHWTPEEQQTITAFQRLDDYGETKAEFSLRGKRIPDMDLLIASTAKYYGLVLVAHDKHMRYLPDSFHQENWAKGDCKT